jgi:hypothetical protein
MTRPSLRPRAPEGDRPHLSFTGAQAPLAESLDQQAFWPRNFI